MICLIINKFNTTSIFYFFPIQLPREILINFLELLNNDFYLLKFLIRNIIIFSDLEEYFY